MKVVFGNAAENDLVGIMEWIAAENPVAAKKVVARLSRRCAELNRFPNRYALIRAGSPFRHFVHAPYIVLYTVDAEVTIVRILHGARDYTALLGGMNAGD